MSTTALHPVAPLLWCATPKVDLLLHNLQTEQHRAARTLCSLYSPYGQARQSDMRDPSHCARAADDSVVTGQPATADAMQHMHPHLRRVFTRSSKLADAAACRRRTHRARLISMAVVTAVLAVCAAVVAFLDWRDNGRYDVTVWGVPVFSWLLVGAMTLPLMVAAELLVFGLVFVLDAALSSAFENVQYVLLGMRTGLWCALPRT